MKFVRVSLTITVFCFCFSFVESRRLRRRLDEFGEMILLTADRNPMDFNGYGNWCGFGGDGETVDSIDECCKKHDKCYYDLNHGDCDTLFKYKVYTTAYTWSFKQGEILCDNSDRCAVQLCECDRAAAICFGEHKDVYDPQNKRNGVMKGLQRLIGLKR